MSIETSSRGKNTDVNIEIESKPLPPSAADLVAQADGELDRIDAQIEARQRCLKDDHARIKQLREERKQWARIARALKPRKKG